jgi:hypothetical protein
VTETPARYGDPPAAWDPEEASDLVERLGGLGVALRVEGDDLIVTLPAELAQEGALLERSGAASST